MRKKILIFFFSVLMLTNTLTPVSAAPLQTSTDVSIVIDGQERLFSQPPVIVNDHTLVPFRGVFEILGADVHWDGKTRTVTAVKNDNQIILGIHSDLALVNGKLIKLAQPAAIMNDSTMVPLRFVSEAMGWNVKWSVKTRTAYIESDGAADRDREQDKKEDKPALNQEQEHDAEKAVLDWEQVIDPENAVLDWEQQVVDLVNEERAKAELEPLTLDAELSKVARVKSEDMRDQEYFDHESPVYGSPFEMMDQFGIDYRAAGENIAAGQDSPEAVVKAWMNSPGHKKNILSPDYTHIGVGYADGGSYRHYWTQQFVGR